MNFVNPKVSPGTDPVDEWYRYYAGYSAAFVNQVISEAVTDASVILDPWNGTGTTTVVAANRKIEALGFDINPAMVVVSRARLLDKGVSASIDALADDIIAHATPVKITEEPLLFWFNKRASASIRGLQASTHRLLVDSSSRPFSVLSAVAGMSTLASFFYTALFRTIRLLIEPVSGTNPTWWKRLEENKRLRPKDDLIFECFRQVAIDLSKGLHRVNFDVETTIRVGNCRQLPVEDNLVDAVISSPPYCTRIDYGVSTRPELAILGASEKDIKALRDSMVGTPTVTGDFGLDELWGRKASSFLSQVMKHESKASSSYYLKYFRQYYSGMWDSLGELRRVIKPGGKAVLVVQDNHYKEVRNDAPGILMEMANLKGFERASRHDFTVSNNRASMNPRAKKYRKKAKAVESVIVLQ